MLPDYYKTSIIDPAILPKQSLNSEHRSMLFDQFGPELATRLHGIDPSIQVSACGTYDVRFYVHSLALRERLGDHGYASQGVHPNDRAIDYLYQITVTGAYHPEKGQHFRLSERWELGRGNEAAKEVIQSLMDPQQFGFGNLSQRTYAFGWSVRFGPVFCLETIPEILVAPDIFEYLLDAQLEKVE